MELVVVVVVLEGAADVVSFAFLSVNIFTITIISIIARIIKMAVYIISLSCIT